MKKSLYLVASVLLLMVIVIEAVWVNNAVPAFAFNTKEKPIYSVDTAEKKVAISFDAAWGADNTVKILDILDSYKVNATFFLVGFWVEDHSDLVKEIDRRGYEIGNHSLNHPNMSKLSCDQMRNEVLKVNEAIKAITGKTPDVFRPPYGDYNDNVIKTLRECNMHTIQWSIDSLDWKELGREKLVQRVLKNVQCGDIILFHNNAKYTPEALPEIIESIQNMGYTITSVGDLIYKSEYYIDSQGIQHCLVQ